MKKVLVLLLFIFVIFTSGCSYEEETFEDILIKKGYECSDDICSIEETEENLSSPEYDNINKSTEIDIKKMIVFGKVYFEKTTQSEKTEYEFTYNIKEDTMDFYVSFSGNDGNQDYTLFFANMYIMYGGGGKGVSSSQGGAITDYEERKSYYNKAIEMADEVRNEWKDYRCKS